MGQEFHQAYATKMLSIMQMCPQCPLQVSLYGMLYRYHAARIKSTSVQINCQRNKYDWWEFKMLKMIQDNDVKNDSLGGVYDHIMAASFSWLGVTE